MSTELRRALDRVAGRHRGVRLWGSLALCWVAIALVGGCLCLVIARPGTETYPVGLLLGWLASIAGVALAIAWPILRSGPDPRLVARQVEAKFPALGTGLLAAVEEDIASPHAPRGFLQSAVIREAVLHARTHDWPRRWSRPGRSDSPNWATRSRRACCSWSRWPWSSRPTATTRSPRR